VTFHLDGDEAVHAPLAGPSTHHEARQKALKILQVFLHDACEAAKRYCLPSSAPQGARLSLTGFRLVIADHALGLPVLRTLELAAADHTSPERVMQQVYCSAFIGGCHGSDRLARLRQTVGQSHGLAGEHAIYGRVHAALLLSLAGAWATGAPASAVSHTAAFECDLDHTRSRDMAKCSGLSSL
jgi:hypothetical protein